MSYTISLGVLMRLEIAIREETNPDVKLELMNELERLKTIVLRPDTKTTY